MRKSEQGLMHLSVAVVCTLYSVICACRGIMRKEERGETGRGRRKERNRRKDWGREGGARGGGREEGRWEQKGREEKGGSSRKLEREKDIDMVPTTNPLHVHLSPATDQWGHSEWWWCYHQQSYRWV